MGSTPSLTREELRKLGEPSAEWQETNPGIMYSKDSYSLEDLYQLRLDTGPAPPPLPEGITVEDRQIWLRDGSTIAIRIYSPVKPGASGRPLVVNYHGGGFFIGNLETEVEMCQRLVTNYNAVVVYVDYRLAPEFPFPIGVNDSWDALQWVAQNATPLNVNPELGLIMSGVSAGANFAAVMSILAGIICTMDGLVEVQQGYAEQNEMMREVRNNLNLHRIKGEFLDLRLTFMKKTEKKN